MQLQNQYPQTLCKKCDRFVPTSNYLIHQARCAGPSRIGTSHRSRLPKKQEPQIQQKIPCHYCSYQQTLAELDTHPLQCSHRQIQCTQCHQKIPLSLLDDHKIICLQSERNSPLRRQVNLPRNRVIEEQRDAIIFEPQVIPPPRARVRQILRIPTMPRPLPRSWARIEVNVPEVEGQVHQNQQSPQQVRMRLFHQRIMQERARQIQNINNLRSQYESLNVNNHRDLFPNRNINSNRNSGNRQNNRNRNRSNNFIQLVANRHRKNQNKKMSSTEIKQLPVIEYMPKNEELDPELCAICYCQYEQKERVMSLPCKHLFHPDCISQWLKKNQLCPICKQSCRKNK